MSDHQAEQSMQDEPREEKPELSGEESGRQSERTDDKYTPVSKVRLINADSGNEAKIQKDPSVQLMQKFRGSTSVDPLQKSDSKRQSIQINDPVDSSDDNAPLSDTEDAEPQAEDEAPQSEEQKVTAAEDTKEQELDEKLDVPPPAHRRMKSEHRQTTAAEQNMARKILVDAFNIFDADGQGTIESDELTSIVYLVGLKAEESNVKSIAETMTGQASDSIKVNLDQFVASMEKYTQGFRGDENDQLQEIFDAIQSGAVAKLKRAFDTCDADKSGEIDFGEFKAVMRSLGEALQPDEQQKLYAELDADGSGGVTFQEFLHFMCKRKGTFEKQKGKKMGNLKFFSVDALNALSNFMSDTPVDEKEQAAAENDMPFLERVGATFMKKNYRKAAVLTEAPTKPMNEVHILSKAERKELNRIEMMAIMWDCILGAISATLSGVAEQQAGVIWHVDGTSDNSEDGDPYTGSDTFAERIVFYWLLLGSVSIVASALEIILIYYVHLTSAIRVSQVTGLRLFPVDKEKAFVTSALARAALELPHPSKAEFGVDPLAEASKARLFFAAIIYKAKTGISTFLLRLLLKRVLARVAVKSFLPFVAIPVNVFWNALVGYKCLKGARVIALGPSVALEVMDGLLSAKQDAQQDDAFHPLFKEGMLRAIAVAIVDKEVMHPNLRILLGHTEKKLNLFLSLDAMQADVDAKNRKNSKAPKEDSKEKAPENDPGSELELQKVETSAEPLTQASDIHITINNEDASPEPALIANAPKLVSVDSYEKGGEPNTLTAPKGKRRRSSTGGGITRPGNSRKFRQWFQRYSTSENLNLSPERRKLDQIFILQIFSFACVLDGHVRGSLIKRYRKICKSLEVSDDSWPLHWLTIRFLRGQLHVEDLLDLFDRESLEAKKIASTTEKCKHQCDRCLLAMAC